MYRIRKQLIKSLSQALTEGVNELGEKYQAVQILPELQKDYPTELRQGLVSVRIYQTEKASFLETTIDELIEIDINEEDTYTPGEEYSWVSFRTKRDSLAMFGSENGGPFFNLQRSVVENAALFITDIDSEALSYCPNLFSDEAVKEINGRHFAEQDSDDEYEFKAGEIEFAGEILKDMDGYDSDDDPEFLRTPLATLAVEDDKISIILNQTDEHVGKGQPAIQGNLPSFIVIRSVPSEDFRLTTLFIPIDKINAVIVKAGNEPSAGYELPGRYEYIVELKSGERLIVEGEFGEDSESPFEIPQYWYYRHKIICR